MRLAENVRKEGVERLKAEVAKKELEEELGQLKKKLTLKPEVAEVGTQASPETVDASTEPISGVGGSKELEGAIKRKKEKTERKKEKGKGKEGAKDRRSGGDTPPPTKPKEDVIMEDLDRYSPYEDLSGYEKEVEDVALVITKRQVVLAKAENPNLPNTSQPLRPLTRRNTSTRRLLWSTEFPATDPQQKQYIY